MIPAERGAGLAKHREGNVVSPLPIRTKGSSGVTPNTLRVARTQPDRGRARSGRGRRSTRPGLRLRRLGSQWGSISPFGTASSTSRARRGGQAGVHPGPVPNPGNRTPGRSAVSGVDGDPSWGARAEGSEGRVCSRPRPSWADPDGRAGRQDAVRGRPLPGRRGGLQAGPRGTSRPARWPRWRSPCWPHRPHTLSPARLGPLRP